MLVDTLETCDHHHAAGLEVATDFLIVDLQDARLVVRAVGEDPHLVTGVGHRRNTALDQGHGQQGDGHLLAGGDDHIQFTRNRLIADLLGQVDQAIGFTAHRRQYNHQVIAGFANFLTLSATCSIRSTVPTEVPPNFCTINAISKPPQPMKGTQ